MTLLFVFILVLGFLTYLALCRLLHSKSRKTILLRISATVLFVLLYLGYKIYVGLNTTPDDQTSIKRNAEE